MEVYSDAKYVGAFSGDESSFMVCISGWEGPGCVDDLNECDGGDNGGCEDNRYDSVACINTVGGHHCECRPGFLPDNAASRSV